MSLQQMLNDLVLIFPEIALVLTLCAVILVDVVLSREASRRYLGILTLLGLALALLVVSITYGNGHHSVFTTLGAGATEAPGVGWSGPEYAFSRMLVVDKLSDFFKIIFFLGTFAVVLFSMKSEEIKEYRHGEYYTLILATVLGGSFLVSSNNFLMLVLSLETLSLCSYVLAGYMKFNRHSAEASLKYILYGSVASGVMLFGISYIYGMAGTLDIRQAVFNIAMREHSSAAVLLAWVLVIGGLGFKMAAVPFHFWAPDVYQGAPTPITAFLAVVSKAAGFSALLRVTLPLFAVDGALIPDGVLAIRGSLRSVIEQGHLPLLFWILSVLSMTVGNLVALRQTDIKRLLAYSSIAHAGYILMGMTVFNQESLEAMLFYLFMYLFMNIGAFAIVIIMMNKTGSSNLEAYRGLGYRNPWAAVMMVIFMISLTGIPPTAGFVGKLMIFKVVVGAGSSALDHGAITGASMFYYSLALIGGVNTAISLFYYMKVAKVMILDKPKDEAPVPFSSLDWACLLGYGAPVILLFLRFDPVLLLVQLFVR